MVKPVRKSQRRESRKVEAEPLIWERMSRAPHGRSGLSYDNIVKAAMSIADSEGLQAISMRRIADELGSGTMSLYRYVSSKEQILDLVLNDAYGEIRVPAMVSGDWRNDLRELARQTRTVWARHPWLATLLTQRPPFGPNYLRWFEFSLAATAHLRLPITTRTRIVGTLNAYVAGVVAYESGEVENDRRCKLTPQQKRRIAAPYLEQTFATGLYPELRRFVESSAGEPDEEGFEFGLECVLAGLAAVIEESGDKKMPGRE